MNRVCGSGIAVAMSCIASRDRADAVEDEAEEELEVEHADEDRASASVGA